MSVYFSHFPKILYGNQIVRDITRRTNFLDQHLSNPFLFLPYTIQDGEKPEDIAHYYYGSVDYTWLVLMSNGIFDTYTEWPMNQEVWEKYMIQKYRTQAGSDHYSVIDWTRNQTITENILFHYNEELDVRVNPETIMHTADPSGFRPIRIYEYEMELNEFKRNIRLVDRSKLDSVVSEFRSRITG
ncbi:MAG: baseplate wedge protein 53 [Anaerolineaceae bacterium]